MQHTAFSWCKRKVKLTFRKIELKSILQNDFQSKIVEHFENTRKNGGRSPLGPSPKSAYDKCAHGGLKGKRFFCRVAWSPFVEGPEKFMITELFYSHILNEQSSSSYRRFLFASPFSDTDKLKMCPGLWRLKRAVRLDAHYLKWILQVVKKYHDFRKDRMFQIVSFSV